MQMNCILATNGGHHLLVYYTNPILALMSVDSDKGSNGGYFYNIVNGVDVHPNLPLVPHSPQHILRNTHSFMQFSAHTNRFQHSFFSF